MRCRIEDFQLQCPSCGWVTKSFVVEQDADLPVEAWDEVEDHFCPTATAE